MAFIWSHISSNLLLITFWLWTHIHSIQIAIASDDSPEITW